MSNSKSSTVSDKSSPRVAEGEFERVQAVDQHAHPNLPPLQEGRKKEFGGREGLDPTRYGDWEKSGRCIDF